MLRLFAKCLTPNFSRQLPLGFLSMCWPHLVHVLLCDIYYYLLVLLCAVILKNCVILALHKLLSRLMLSNICPFAKTPSYVPLSIRTNSLTLFILISVCPAGVKFSIPSILNICPKNVRGIFLILSFLSFSIFLRISLVFTDFIHLLYSV